MFYQSTRSDRFKVESATAITQGIAPDGGLFVPMSIPVFEKERIAGLSASGYNARAIEVLSEFLTDFSQDELTNCVNLAYNKEKFETTNIAPLYKFDDSLFIQELWHGPTCAFKDMALQILPHLMRASANKANTNEKILILVATSGDTGKAALEGFKDVEGCEILVFYPRHGVSKIQELQMVTTEGSNVHVCAIDGNFDDAQNQVKAIFSDTELAERLNSKGVVLSSANSINWGRLVPQIVYYFSAYLDLLKNSEISIDDSVNFVVPTGNFGNILAAYYAKCMGLPINKLICASNYNNVLTEFIKTGIYNRKREFFTTISPSMDILMSSNLERLLFHITNGNTRLVQGWFSLLKDEGRYEVTNAVHTKIKELFWAGYCDDNFTKKTIKDVDNAFSYVIDPHTAVAVDVYWQYLRSTGDKHKTVIASTASPFKFNRSVLSALMGGDDKVENVDEIELLSVLSRESQTRIPHSLATLNTKPIRFLDVCTKEEMAQYVERCFQ